MCFRLGYYVAAGIPIQIDIEKQEGVTGWCARIGCHSDDLKNCNELRRWHCISICKSLTTETVKVLMEDQAQLLSLLIMLF
jgi:hypothetical protein